MELGSIQRFGGSVLWSGEGNSLSTLSLAEGFLLWAFSFGHDTTRWTFGFSLVIRDNSSRNWCGEVVLGEKKESLVCSKMEGGLTRQELH